MRARVLVRCVCGYERLVFVSDLRSSKTSGCRSRDCLTRWQAARMFRAHLDDFLAGAGSDGV